MLKFLPLYLIGLSLHGQSTNIFSNPRVDTTHFDKVEQYYLLNRGNDSLSQSVGNVSNGRLINGKLMPFSSINFRYFDTLSYICGRAFVNENVLQIVLSTYKYFEMYIPERKFVLMECSNKNGGKIFFHNTHQNGLSVDFMTPLIRNDKPCHELNGIGASIYKLDFDNNGKCINDKSVSIDFELVSEHILILDTIARTHGLKIAKVIIKTELKKHLFSTSNGQILKNSGIYFAQKLTPLLNSSHDDHYHIDFEFIK